MLRNYIRYLLENDADKPEDDLLTEPDLSEDEDGDETTEQNVAANVAGYTLPLGASNYPTTLRQRGEIAGTGFGGAEPVKKRRRG